MAKKKKNKPTKKPYDFREVLFLTHHIDKHFKSVTAGNLEICRERLELLKGVSSVLKEIHI